jgi:hypothetical protein
MNLEGGQPCEQGRSHLQSWRSKEALARTQSMSSQRLLWLKLKSTSQGTSNFGSNFRKLTRVWIDYLWSIVSVEVKFYDALSIWFPNPQFFYLSHVFYLCHLKKTIIGIWVPICFFWLLLNVRIIFTDTLIFFNCNTNVLTIRFTNMSLTPFSLAFICFINFSLLCPCFYLAIIIIPFLKLRSLTATNSLCKLVKMAEHD